MATIKFTAALKRFFPDIKSDDIEANSLLELLDKLNAQHDGLIDYILDDQRCLRKHVNIFINGSAISEKNDLNQRISHADEIFIIQALSGG